MVFLTHASHWRKNSRRDSSSFRNLLTSIEKQDFLNEESKLQMSNNIGLPTECILWNLGIDLQSSFLEATTNELVITRTATSSPNSKPFLSDLLLDGCGKAPLLTGKEGRLSALARKGRQTGLSKKGQNFHATSSSGIV